MPDTNAFIMQCLHDHSFVMRVLPVLDHDAECVEKTCKVSYMDQFWVSNYGFWGPIGGKFEINAIVDSNFQSDSRKICKVLTKWGKMAQL